MSGDNDNDANGPDAAAHEVMGRPGTGEKLTELDKFAAPFNQEIKLQAVKHLSGLQMLRINIRERRRFTVFDVDADTARHWAKVMNAWADAVEESDGAGDDEA